MHLARLMLHLARICHNDETITKEMRKLKKNGMTTIRGIVVPVDWDHEGNPSSVAIATQTEEEYLVSKDLKGKELLFLIREEVEVTGTVNEIAGIKIICLTDIAKCNLNNPFKTD